MFTQCPACQTVYRLRLDQLRAARGQVRCSRCDTIFDALDHRVSQQAPPPAPVQQSPQRDQTVQATALSGAATIPSETARAETARESESGPAIEAHGVEDAAPHLDGKALSRDIETSPSTAEDNQIASSAPEALDQADTTQPTETTTSSTELDAPTVDLPQALDLADIAESAPEPSERDAPTADLPQALDLDDIAESAPEPSERDAPAADLPQALDLDDIAGEIPAFFDDVIPDHELSPEGMPLEKGRDEDELSPAPDHLSEAVQAIELDSPELTPEQATGGDTSFQPSFGLDAEDHEEETFSATFSAAEERISGEAEEAFRPLDADTEAETAWPELLTEPEAPALADELTEEAGNAALDISTDPDADRLEEDFASLWDSALDADQTDIRLPEDGPLAETTTLGVTEETETSDNPAAADKDWDDFSEQHIESLLTPAEGGELPEIAMVDDGDVVMNTELSGSEDALDLDLDLDLDLASFSSDDDSKLDVDDFEFEHEASQPDTHRERDPDEILLKQLLPEEDLDLDVPAPEDVVTTTPVPPQSPSPSARQAASYHIEPEPAPRRGSSSFSTLLWAGGILLMLGTLVGQFAYYHQSSLASHPQLRPLLAQLCHFTECELPPQRDLSQIRLASHLVQFHPRHQDSLLVTATLINRADFSQPYPDVALLMTDLQQQVVASRRFSPQEYLVGQRSDQPMPRNIEIPLMLEVLDPGREVVGFRFEFY
ncbi:MAG: zinc-ribbon domain-containing protein [Chromatiales bacterium]|nr:zinc-ribbon domain-containing protein [Chromatiales bacterium]